MILVTGEGGYISSQCVQDRWRGYQLLVLDNLSQSHPETVLPEHFAQVDLIDPKGLNETFECYY
ncbi:MAG: hypothetical protein PWQ39_1005 [Thermacetogenium sp.]|nr:hypothetical protein [Thermacetogenium sp.]